MREIQEVERTFKNYLNYGNVIGPITMYLIITPMVSLIVSSFLLFILFTILLLLELFAGWRSWRSGVDRQSHQRMIGFFMILNFGLHAVMPLFFLSFGTILFYISLGTYLLLLFFLITKTKVIAEGIHNPAESWIGKAFIITAAIIVFVAIPADARPTEGLIMRLLDDKVKQIYIITSMYLVGLVITFVLPVFFYPADFKAEEQPKGRRKLSRAERKALKAKKVNKKAETDVS
ncbi:hypothetical protein AM500_19160 [Bacillus sp. FJAT-18017]|uniref:hypothetical protein n=1 Tax=Bacillus sp. FJAT-18017 TaxID=1705566 RepID=UPI0006AE6ED5|nr:hypothetical protein [Bacillus sp. FJAT-18017]ALC91665.1 hypothetical protein AM500_19160 [Bacillus sp. FJAT-18017]